MPALRPLPRGLPRPTRRPPSLGRSALLTVLALALGGCQISISPKSLRELFAPDWANGSAAPTRPAPFVDPAGTPPPSVNAPALAALTAAATAATQAARTAAEPAAAAAASQTFDAALVAKAPPALVSNVILEQQVIAALSDGIVAGTDGVPPGAPELTVITQATLSAAQAANYRFDAAQAKTAIDAAVAQARAARLARSVAAAITADPKSAVDQVTAAIRQAPDQAVAIVDAALLAAPSEHAAIAAAATTASAGTPSAAAVAAAVNETNSARTLRALTAALQADPADATRHLAAAIRQDPPQALNLVGTAIHRTPQLAPDLAASALDAAPTQALPIAAIAIALAPAQGEAIRIAALRTAERLGLPAATLATLRDQTPTMLMALHFPQNAAAAAASGSTPAWLAQAQSSLPAPTSSPTARPVATASGRRPVGNTKFIRENQEFATVMVLYGTDRAPDPDLTLDKWNKELPEKGSDFLYFGPKREKSLTGLRYGRSYVTIPKRSALGTMDRPGSLSKESIVAHVMLRGITELDKGGFENELGTLTRPDPGQTAGKDAFIFIHGFNVTFNEAVMRAAQMAYDFGFLGAPVVYSWSSAGALSPQAQQHDPENVNGTVKNLKAFVMQVQRHTQGNVHLVAHSMGNRALVEVLKQLAADWVDARSRIDLRPGRTKLFGEIVLAAPDVPELDFTPADALAVKALADRVSLYVADDLALHFSKQSGNDRLGLAGPGMFIADGVQTINAAGADTDWFSLRHGYAYNVPQVMRDLQAILLNRAKPDQHPRSLFEQKSYDKRTYWSVLKNVPENAKPAPKKK